MTKVTANSLDLIVDQRFKLRKVIVRSCFQHNNSRLRKRRRTVMVTFMCRTMPIPSKLMIAPIVRPPGVSKAAGTAAAKRNCRDKSDAKNVPQRIIELCKGPQLRIRDFLETTQRLREIAL